MSTALERAEHLAERKHVGEAMGKWQSHHARLDSSAKVCESDPEPQDVAHDIDVIARPQTRADCTNGPRPCPWATCRYHLATEATQDVLEMEHSCALDLASDGTRSVADIAELLGVSRQTVNVTLQRAMEKVRKQMAKHEPSPRKNPT
jgi:hypothetical protein